MVAHDGDGRDEQHERLQRLVAEGEPAGSQDGPQEVPEGGVDDGERREERLHCRAELCGERGLGQSRFSGCTRWGSQRAEKAESWARWSRSTEEILWRLGRARILVKRDQEEREEAEGGVLDGERGGGGEEGGAAGRGAAAREEDEAAGDKEQLPASVWVASVS